MYRYYAEIWRNDLDYPVATCTDDSFKNVYSVCVSYIKDLESRHTALLPKYYVLVYVDDTLKYRLKYRSSAQALYIRRYNEDSSYYNYVYNRKLNVETIVRGYCL